MERTEDIEVRVSILCNCGLTHTFDEWQRCPLALKERLYVYDWRVFYCAAVPSNERG